MKSSRKESYLSQQTKCLLLRHNLQITVSYVDFARRTQISSLMFYKIGAETSTFTCKQFETFRGFLNSLHFRVIRKKLQQEKKNNRFSPDKCTEESKKDTIFTT